MTTGLDDLLAHCRAGGRVCPMPLVWKQIWEMLPERQRTGGDWSPPLPLVLAAWETTTDEQKRERLTTHIRWAAEHGAFDQVAALILGLRDRDWRTERGDWGA